MCVDQSGIDLPERLRTETQPGHYAGTIWVDEHVGNFDEL